MNNKQIAELYGELVRVDKELASLEGQKATIKAKLTALIPVDSAKGGVRHAVRIGSSVSWSKVASEWLDRLIPKTKHEEAAKIKEEFTKPTEAHLFSLEQAASQKEVA